MDEIKIKLSLLWVCLMLTFLLGDVMRIFSGDFNAGELVGMQITQELMLMMAILMIVPVVMVYLSITLNKPINRWTNIIVSTFFFCFNLVGLPTYASLYDQFLIIVGLGFNVITIWIAWKWT